MVQPCKGGDTIGLLNTTREKMGTTAVRSVHVVSKEEMLAEHAHLNHLMLAKGSKDPVADLTKTVRNLYGTNSFAKVPLITVIYLRRFEGEILTPSHLWRESRLGDRLNT
ncbi:hypothetical protein EAW52_25505 [Pseudomonas sp. LTJR-52]|nr:hypothetical protein EAW52_25505 [Pseudomonas sp. LTJR-52]